MAVITVSREAGCGGDEVAHRVCEMLGFRYLDKSLIAQVASEKGIGGAEMLESFSEDAYGRRDLDGDGGDDPRYVTHEVGALVEDTIRALTAPGRVVLVGRGGQAVLRDVPGVLHVRIVGRLEDRIERLMQAEGLSHEAARDALEERDRATSEYLHWFHGIDWDDASVYHLTLNSSLLGVEACAELIVAAAQRLWAHSGGLTGKA